MKKNTQELFQMGEVTKALGITRRILINYENHGLITPAVRNDKRGFRYYSVDNIVHIRLIRNLQNLGLSLSEIQNYIDNSGNIDEKIHRLTAIRAQLDQYIAQLQLRQAETGTYTVHSVVLPAFTAYCREFSGLDLAGKTSALRQTYIDAMKSYCINTESRMCTQIPFDNPDDGLFIVPVDNDSKGSAIRKFPATSALCIYYRGPYENFGDIHRILRDYAAEHDMVPHGIFRNMYMEGPPTHGANSKAYITQITMPIKFVTL